MKKNVESYIGVTGFTDKSQIDAALKCIPSTPSRHLMIGVLMSSNTLDGRSNASPTRYPDTRIIRDIFPYDHRVLNLLHYNTRDVHGLYDQLMRTEDMGIANLDGFQFNIAWPPVTQLESYKRLYPERFILLQIGSYAMEQVKSIGDFGRLIKPYFCVIDAVLIDPSGGKGLMFDPSLVTPFLHEASHYPDLVVGVAGGLSHDNLSTLRPLVDIYPRLSIDAEGRLRTPKPEDALCMKEVSKYITGAYSFFGNK